MANGTWKIARRGSTAQLPIIVLGVFAVVLVLWGKAQPGLFDATRTRISDWSRPLLVAVSAPVESVSRWIGSIGDIFSVYSENLRLKEENARLRQWHNAALVLEDRVKRYQLLLNAVPDPTLTTTTARVIGRASKPFLETMILDAGKQQGVKPGQAVVDARGMIGRIFLAGDNTSWVILLTDLNSRIPVVIQPGNIQAILVGDNSVAPSLELSGLGTSLRDGMQVLTSGDGGLLPPGISIRTVYLKGSQSRVALLADAGTASDVQILAFRNAPDKPPAPSPSDLPATAAGLKPQPAVTPPTTTSGTHADDAANGGSTLKNPAVALHKPAPVVQTPPANTTDDQEDDDVDQDQ